jgi:hypothetical protein
MADNLDIIDRFTPTSGIGQKVDEMVTYAENQRKSFERKWYDNNFFDDGYHFRYVSRSTGKIVDVNTSDNANMPQRAIPKASRQIRGIANLLMGLEPVPVVYPEKVSISQFPPTFDPQSGQLVENPAYKEALERARDIAQKAGHWLMNEWEEQDLKEKLMFAVILAAKHSVSFIQCWPDAVEEKIKTQVYDAFDIYLSGNVTDIEDSPFLIKAVPQLISVIKANELFDKEQLKQITPDNKYASSEIKQAYMQSKLGSGMESDNAATLILKEAFVKEYLTEQNFSEVAKKTEDANWLKERKPGDMVMRHIFSAGGIWLLDEYVDLINYPFTAVQLESGPLYQTPLMDRFIPTNKSLDIVTSRIERYLNTMITGTWLARDGENFQITNISGGQVLKYKTTPPVQANMVNLPPAIFQYVGLLEKFIDEQGTAAASFNQLPSGVKSGVAIESVKATEYANLKIATDMLKKAVKDISEKILVYMSDFVQPHTVYSMEDKNPEYFDVMGQRGIEARKSIAAMQGEEFQLPQDTIPITKDMKVNIEVESGMGYTMEGKKATMQQLVGFFTPLIQAGLVPPEAIAVLSKKLLETYQFGATQEFVEALQSGATMQNEQQIQQLKVALLETMQEAGVVGQEADQKQVMTSKIGTVEALNDLAGDNEQPQQ